MNTVLITGGNRGLGYELVKVFHQNNYQVFVVVRNEDIAKEMIKQFKDRVHIIVTDIGFDTSIDIIKSTLNQYTESLDILINNAGIPGREYEIENVTSQEISELLNVHCIGVIRTVQATLSFLKNSTNPRIINISSRLGSLSKMSSEEFANRNFSYSYRIAKASQNMLSICLNHEFRDKGIRVKSIHPGKLKTKSGSSDADIEPKEAAERIFSLVQDININKLGGFIEPYVREWPW